MTGRRARLDGEPDVVVSDGNVGFRHMFETVEDSETSATRLRMLSTRDDAS